MSKDLFGRGRPEKPIDWDRVEQLCRAGCSGPEIAPYFDMHFDTLYRKVKSEYGMTFTEYSAFKRAQGDSQLKEKQFLKALEGDNTLLIWLGKCRLKQRDFDNPFEETPKVQIVNYSDTKQSDNVTPQLQTEELPVTSSESAG
jgi:hypothetical protein